MSKEQLREHLKTHINNYSKNVILNVIMLIESEEITTTEQIDEHFNG